MEIKLQAKKSGLTTILQLLALIVIVSIFLKGIIDIDISYDTWGYHLPFAARMWNIVPAEQYINMEERFAGFPIFAEFLQGSFWFVTNRVQAANLLGWSSIVVYVYFLRAYFRIPLFLSAIALLAIPLVQTHATSCYVDLPGNIGLAILIMMSYFLYQRKEFPTKRDFLVIFLAAASASNTKPQLQPLVFLVLCFIGLRILWLRFQHSAGQKHSQWLLKAIPIAILASLLIFATPIKNIAFHGNPFYPVRIEIAGKVLNHTLPMYQAAPGYLSDAPRAQRWLYSILEINSAKWSVDQWSNDPNRNRMGGFFGAYVVFHLLLFGYLCLRNYRSRETRVVVTVVMIMSLVAANFPQSHELRYFMYWMISLVSINLYLVSREEQLPSKLKLINSRNVGLVSLFALAIVIAKTNFIYIKPSFYSLEQFVNQHVDDKIIAAIEPGDKICLIGKYPYTFLYTSRFHPNLDYTYSIQAAGNPNQCTVNKKVIEK